MMENKLQEGKQLLFVLHLLVYVYAARQFFSHIINQSKLKLSMSNFGIAMFYRN